MDQSSIYLFTLVQYGNKAGVQSSVPEKVIPLTHPVEITVQFLNALYPWWWGVKDLQVNKYLLPLVVCCSSVRRGSDLHQLSHGMKWSFLSFSVTVMGQNRKEGGCCEGSPEFLWASARLSFLRRCQCIFDRSLLESWSCDVSDTHSFLSEIAAPAVDEWLNCVASHSLV